MKIDLTENVIRDLALLYFAGEASRESCELVEAYFAAHPELAEILRRENDYRPYVLPPQLEPEEEMKILNKTKKLLKWRSVVMAIAILFTALPFSFGSVSWDKADGVAWLWADHPLAAVVIGLVGLVAWGGYWALQKRLKASAL
ncbi:MAG TPA: hypothetical protein PLG66_10730 [Calditrichia bacterium]|nr:hypothetical protein [Calditrichia bacterium]